MNFAVPKRISVLAIGTTLDYCPTVLFRFPNSNGPPPLPPLVRLKLCPSKRLESSAHATLLERQRKAPPCRSALLQALSLTFSLTLLLGGSGCTEETTAIATDDSSSSAALLFRLSDFLGDVPCSAAPGALRSYVATLVDRTASDICGDGQCVPPETIESCPGDCADPNPCGDGMCNAAAPILETAETCPIDCGGTLFAQFTLPSSLPVSCSQGVRFDNVAENHRYSVQVDGYEAFASEIGPEGFENPDTQYLATRTGARRMVDLAGNPVTPRFLGSCGEGEQARTVVLETGTSVVLECDPLRDTKTSSSKTAVEITPKDALGTLQCGTDGESTVATFDIRPEGGLGDILGIPCSESAFTQAYSADTFLEGEAVHFYVAAHAKKDDEPLWGSTCSAVVKKGLTTKAACFPLSADGNISVDMAKVLDQYGFQCGSNFATFDLEIVGPETSLKESDVVCEKPHTLGPFAKGDYSVSLTVRADDGKVLFETECIAKVEPGRTAPLACPAL